MHGLPWTPRLRRTPGPLYAGLVEALASDISSGRLGSNARLPTVRELASALDISPGTVTRAYAEAERRGLIRSRVGAGTFVRELTDPRRYTPMLDPHRIDLGPTAVPIVPGDLGHRALAAALAALGARADLGALSGYQPPGGTAAQRRSGARWLRSAGVDAEEGQVTLCSGVQHATLMVLTALAAPTGLLVEELTYPGVLSAAALLRLPTHPVAMDAQGLVPKALAQVCQQSGARVLYCTPTSHNPTTSVMPLARRRELVAVCRELDITIVENGALAPLVANAPLPLAAMAPDRTYHLTSLSKATVPALRIGFIRAPSGSAVHRALEDAASATVWSSSPLMAQVATQWIDDGTAVALRDARRAEAAARQTLAAKVLAGNAYAAHPTAYFLWMPIPEGRRATQLVEQAAARNVLIGPSHLFAARAGSAPNAVRISLAAARSRMELERGLTVLAELLAAPGAHPPGML